MKKVVFLAVLALLATPAVSYADPGHEHGSSRAYGEPGNPKKPARVIELGMKDADGKMEFVPNRIEVKKGEQVRFVMKNHGGLDHEMVLATLKENLKHAEEMRKNPDMEHDDPNAKRLKPNGQGEILWKFTKAGEFDFSCLIPGHRESGMFGTVIVR